MDKKELQDKINALEVLELNRQEMPLLIDATEDEIFLMKRYKPACDLFGVEYRETDEHVVIARSPENFTPKSDNAREGGYLFFSDKICFPTLTEEQSHDHRSWIKS